MIFDCYNFLYMSCKENLCLFIFTTNHFFFCLLSGAEAAKVPPSMSDETHANSASRVKEKERFPIGDHSQVVESCVSQASYNDQSDENRSSDARQGFADDSVAGKLLLEFSGSFTQMKKLRE